MYAMLHEGVTRKISQTFLKLVGIFVIENDTTKNMKIDSITSAWQKNKCFKITVWP